MNGLEIGFISSLLALLLTVIGIGIKIGVQTQRLIHAEKRIEKSEDKIEELEKSNHQIEIKFEQINGTLGTLKEILIRVERKIKSGESYGNEK